MADLNVDTLVGTTDKRHGRGSNTYPAAARIANYDNVNSLKARLTAINATSYTPARLATMSKNDMVYAVRLADDAAGI